MHPNSENIDEYKEKISILYSSLKRLKKDPFNSNEIWRVNLHMINLKKVETLISNKDFTDPNWFQYVENSIENTEKFISLHSPKILTQENSVSYRLTFNTESSGSGYLPDHEIEIKEGYGIISFFRKIINSACHIFCLPDETQIAYAYKPEPFIRNTEEDI